MPPTALLIQFCCRYGIFGFEYELFLSTRPENYLGEIATWDKAEAELTRALNTSGRAWKLNPGDGAFYGPKIDILLFDALKRKHQVTCRPSGRVFAQHVTLATNVSTPRASVPPSKSTFSFPSASTSASPLRHQAAERRAATAPSSCTVPCSAPSSA